MRASIGRPVVATIVYELEIMFGIMLEGMMPYKLSRIDDALRKLLGVSAADLTMQHIRAVLDNR